MRTPLEALCASVGPCSLAHAVAVDQAHAAAQRPSWPLQRDAWDSLLLTMQDEDPYAEDDHQDPAHIEAEGYYLATRGVPTR